MQSTVYTFFLTTSSAQNHVLRLLHMAMKNCGSHFQCCLVFHCDYAFIHSTGNTHLDCFQLGAIINRTAMKIPAHVVL